MEDNLGVEFNRNYKIALNLKTKVTTEVQVKYSFLFIQLKILQV